MDDASSNSPAINPQAAWVADQLACESPLISCRFDPTGRFVFVCCENSTIQRWELATKNKTVLKGHESWPRGLAFTPSGDLLISSAYDDTIIWWSATADAPEPVRRIKAHAGWVDSVSTSPDGKFVASGGSDRMVRIWNVEDGQLVRELTGHEKHVYSVLFHPDGQYLLSGDLGGKVNQWEVATGNLVRTFDATALWSYNGGQAVDYGGVRTIAISPDKTQLACGGLHQASNPLGAVNDPIVLRFNWETQEKLKSHLAGDVKGVAWRTLFHPQGILLACSGGSGGGWLLFWNATDEQIFHKFQLPNTARDMDLHPDGIQVATAHHDQQLRITRLVPKA
jgi:WD40 repeat protein